MHAVWRDKAFLRPFFVAGLNSTQCMSGTQQICSRLCLQSLCTTHVSSQEIISDPAFMVKFK